MVEEVRYLRICSEPREDLCHLRINAAHQLHLVVPFSYIVLVDT